MEIYFTNLCIKQNMFKQVLNFGAGLRIYCIVLLIPTASSLKMREIPAHIYSV